MNNVFNLKVKFENSSKSYEIVLNENENFSEQQENFFNSQQIEEKKIYHLFSPTVNKFITNVNDLKLMGAINDLLFIFKDCTEEAKKIVASMMKVIPNLRINKQDPQLNNELKNIGYRLQNYLLVDVFLEEFISYEGIKTLIEAIEITSGNSRSYLISSFKEILIYKNALEYIKENPIVVINIYHVLTFTDTINTITHTLAGLCIICEFLKPEGINLIYNAAIEFSKVQQTKVFKELVQFINGTHIDIKVNALMLICYILHNSKFDKTLQAEILVHFQDLDLKGTLEKNASECLSNDFQIQLTNYQKITGEIIRGSNYQVI